MDWYKLSIQLSLPIQTLKKSITSTEFVKYRRYFHQDFEATDKATSYMKLIALEVRRSWVEKPSSVQMEDMNLVLASAPTEPLTDAERNAYTQNSKAAWGGFVGVSTQE